jgi:glucose-6-phosphate dehydrogenase assembly protein OpcA
MAQLASKPILAKTWHTNALDTGEIHDEINNLWAELQRVQPSAITSPHGTTDPQMANGLMRANTLNLLAVAPTDRDAHLVRSTVAQLHDFLPTRTIILIMRDERDDDEPEGQYDVTVELLEQESHTNTGSGPQLRFETITIGVPIQDAGHIPSLVEPLFIPELEDFLWWPSGDHTNNQLFLDLVALVDRVIVDSAQLGQSVGQSGSFRRLFDPKMDTPPLGDFTWDRLEPWRSLIAQFFDPPDTQQCLKSIEQVTINYALSREDGSSGAPAAFLMVGWLASRLNWEIIEPVTRNKDGSYWAPLRAQVGAKGREIVLRIIPDHNQHARFSLRSVELVAGGESSGTFRIERTDSDDLVTSSETPTNPFVSRMVFSRRPDAVSMLGDELHRFNRDPVFEDAVRFAVKLIDSKP